MQIEELQKRSHDIAVDKGWWKNSRNIGELLALIHSEVSEALEEWREGHSLTDVRVVDGKPEGFPIELADVLIRVADLAEGHGIDLTEALEIKLGYNANRPYRHGGKLA